MKLQQLRYLIAIADNGLNITAAANHLYTSQPGVSKQLRLLEEELGVQLFVRHGRSLAAITRVGERTLAHARVIMREIAGIRALARGLVDEAQADLDEPLNDRLHLLGSRFDNPATRRIPATLGKRRF